MADDGPRYDEEADSPAREGQEAIVPATEKTSGSGESWLGIRCFVACCSFMLFMQMVFTVYIVSIMRTLERRYSLSSKQTGFILSINDIVHMSVVVFVGYFGKRACKPRAIAALNLFTVAGCLLFVAPYFLFPVTTYRSPGHVTGNATQNNGRTLDTLCNTDTMQEYVACVAQEQRAVRDSSRAAYGVFLVAQILTGLGGSANIALGFSYIDEHAPRSKSTLYLGIATSMFAMGPMSGLFLGALTTRLPENLQHSDLKPGDPAFIGCWWLGFVVCAVLIAICCVPLFLFPDRAIPQSETSADGETRIVPLAQGFAVRVKEFLPSLRALLKNTKYITCLLVGVCDTYIVAGVFIVLPRYLEVHFHLAAYRANALAALPGVSGIIGGLAGGVIMSRLKLKTKGAVRFMMFSTIVVMCGLAIIMMLSCPQENMAGHQDVVTNKFSVVEQCNANCSCSTEKKSFSPVCSAGDITYFSPCHAGCRSFSNGTFSDCQCIEDGRATAGFCHRGCKALVPYLTVTFIAFVVGSLDKVPKTFVLFRIVSAEEKSFAIAINSFAINLLSLIPGPVIFGALVDSSCILWQRICSTDTRGSCLLYDTASFRLLTHGVTLVFMLASLGFIGVLYALIRKDNVNGNDIQCVDSKGTSEHGVSTTTKL
ncbi:hypothetical protein NP493_329g03031 [Ridgeia piscesae]|uniref:Solute carrier organic anion transporter family member n=1 Tax=Ridgeia piscesae TaxID=27915 RepID=A0AAD9L493_RIDPI|nr:hypothetical protein NP493_329g03031 [Ridgeia piscesae]